MSVSLCRIMFCLADLCWVRSDRCTSGFSFFPRHAPMVQPHGSQRRIVAISQRRGGVRLRRSFAAPGLVANCASGRRPASAPVMAWWYQGGFAAGHAQSLASAARMASVARSWLLCAPLWCRARLNSLVDPDAAKAIKLASCKTLASNLYVSPAPLRHQNFTSAPDNDTKTAQACDSQRNRPQQPDR